MQLSYDVLATVGFRKDLLETIAGGFRFLGEMSRARKIVQTRFIARKEVKYQFLLRTPTTRV
jgi:hypothetical protein